MRSKLTNKEYNIVGSLKVNNQDHFIAQIVPAYIEEEFVKFILLPATNFEGYKVEGEYAEVIKNERKA